MGIGPIYKPPIVSFGLFLASAITSTAAENSEEHVHTVCKLLRNAGSLGSPRLLEAKSAI